MPQFHRKGFAPRRRFRTLMPRQTNTQPDSQSNRKDKKDDQPDDDPESQTPPLLCSFRFFLVRRDFQLRLYMGRRCLW